MVGWYVVEKSEGGNDRVKMHIEHFEDRFRHTFEFVLRVSPYGAEDLKKMDVLTFFKLVNECEDVEQQAIQRMEKQILVAQNNG